MAKMTDTIAPDVRSFIEEQHMFFVASAPLSADGHVNLSPKGLDCLRVLGPNQVVYLDLTGSGNETSAHIQENGRITLMFCAFQGPPKILRLYGQGTTILPDTVEWEQLRTLFGEYPGVRQMIRVDVMHVKSSCGFAVPHYEYQGQRDTLIRWANAKSSEQLEAYRHEKNAYSMDGLPTALAALEADI